VAQDEPSSIKVGPAKKARRPGTKENRRPGRASRSATGGGQPKAAEQASRRGGTRSDDRAVGRAADAVEIDITGWISTRSSRRSFALADTPEGGGRMDDLSSSPGARDRRGHRVMDEDLGGAGLTGAKPNHEDGSENAGSPLELG